MSYRYYTCEVFTERLFGGNPLAVLPKADGLSGGQIQQIANFSESDFVFPAKTGQTRHVRMFAPGRKIPFAGHPNVETAFASADTNFGRSATTD
jgi:trans-2,3-dihydro-3-hydroxyanthranilate isomerase